MSSSSLTTTSSMAAESVEFSDTRLSLAIGCFGGRGSPPAPRPVVLFGELFPAPAMEEDHHGGGGGHGRVTTNTGKRYQRGVAGATRQQQSSKKARIVTHGDVDGDRRSPSGGGGGEDEVGSRKKLRLTREQATLLEESFSAHNILSHAQKHDMAGKLGLSARQVEVWFQNRRARTKLKQTEADCDLLRRWCERLADENARLGHDLADLRSSSSSSPFYSSLTAAAAVCPSCDGAGDDKRRHG